MVPQTLKSAKCGDLDLVWRSRTYVMGIINVTPDSFSGDGVGLNVDLALDQARAMAAHGADILDVGGESTRPPAVYPGARPITIEEELARVLPVISAIAGELSTPISIDTYKAEVARRALDAGASMVNDIWGLSRDPEMAPLVAERGVPVVIMHNQEGARYGDLVPDIIAALRRLVESALAKGVKEEQIIVDPGLGFGKTWEQNLVILRRLHEFQSLGYPMLLGASRKSVIGRVLDLPAEERVEGTAATVALGIAAGADIVRVHDVKAMVRVARMSDAIVRGTITPIPAPGSSSPAQARP